MPAGTFTPSELTMLKLKAEQFYANNTAQYAPEAVSAQAILENQSAKFRMFEDVNKDQKVAITWIDA